MVFYFESFSLQIVIFHTIARDDMLSITINHQVLIVEVNRLETLYAKKIMLQISISKKSSANLSFST